MLKSLWYWILTKVLGRKTEANDKEISDNERYAEMYRNIDDINFASIFAGKLSNYTISDSSITIDGDNARSEALNDFTQQIIKDGKKIISMSLGYGGVFIVPYVQGPKKELLYNIVEQNRVIINKMVGQRITSATILAEQKTITNSMEKKIYLRWSDYDIVNNNLTITQKYTDGNGIEIPVPEFWVDIKQSIFITNVDRALIGYFKSSINNKIGISKYGVPITYGCDSTIYEIKEVMKQMIREFNIKQAWVGVDSKFFKKDINGNSIMPDTGLFKKFDSNEDMFQIYAPAYQFDPLYSRYNMLLSRLEKQVCVSKGFLTDVETQNATATEIKRAMYDTFTLVDDIRANFEKGMSDLMYSCNVLESAYGISPDGEYNVTYNWDYSLLQDSNEEFSQLMQGQSKGAVDAVEIRQFIFPNETKEEAEKKIAEIEAKNPTTEQLLGNQ